MHSPSRPNAIDRTGAEIVSWWNEGFTPEADGKGPGWYEPYFRPTAEEMFDPRQLVARSLQFSHRRGTDGTNYFRGKICCGVFARSLIERVRERQGRFAPDCPSRAAGLWLASSALDLGRPLMLSYRTPRSNGPRQRADAGHARRFLAECDPDGAILRHLPVPGVYASLHNLLGYDLVSTVGRVAGGAAPPVNLSQLAIRVEEDLDLVSRGRAQPKKRSSAVCSIM